MKKEAKGKKINEEIARIFYEIADILEIKRVRWKPQAYRMAAQAIESLRKNVAEIYKEGNRKALEKIPGVGEGIAKKIIQYIETGKIQEYEKLKKSLPAELYKIMKIPGVGPKKASLFYKELGIKNIKQLEKAAKQGKIKDLPLFKERAEEKILEGITMLKRQKGRILLRQAEKLGKKIIGQVKKLKEVERIEMAGSLRRKKPTVRDLDMVVQTSSPTKLAEKIVKLPFVRKVLGKGKEKATIITQEGIQADFRFFTKENFGSGILYFTGDKQHNIWLRRKAIKKGWKLNEYGLFKGRKRVAGKTEAEIYKKLKVKMPPPEKRIGETE